MLDTAGGGLSFLAVLQGLTEFLPVSSSGHLVLAQNWLGSDQAPLAVDVALHLGTLGAVLAVYSKDISKLIRGALRGELTEIGLLAVGSIPAAVVGLGFKDTIEGAFHGTGVAGTGLCVTALILLVGEVARRFRAGGDPDEGLPTWRAALVIGTAQALALVPGISRSGSTIAAGMCAGLSPARAARFSFLMSIPAIGGAALLELPELFSGGPGSLGSPGMPSEWALIGAVLLSGAVGWGALKLLLAVLQRGAFAWFALYCAAVGLFVLSR